MVTKGQKVGEGGAADKQRESASSDSAERQREEWAERATRDAAVPG